MSLFFYSHLIPLTLRGRSKTDSINLMSHQLAEHAIAESQGKVVKLLFKME